MAWILRTNGAVEEVAWKTGTDNAGVAGDNTELLCKVFGKRPVTTFLTRDRRLAFADDAGLLDNLPYNAAATNLYRAAGGITPVNGDVVLLSVEETRADEESL